VVELWNHSPPQEILLPATDNQAGWQRQPPPAVRDHYAEPLEVSNEEPKLESNGEPKEESQ
jgi:hypothetical protein